MGTLGAGLSLSISKLSIYDELSQGYEGAKLYWEGVIIQPDARYGFGGITWHIGEPRPTITGLSGKIGPSSWSFSRSNFDLDPIGDSSEWQNLIGISRTSGIMENIPGTNIPLSNTVSWNINLGVNEKGETQMRYVKANTYFFKSQTEFKVRVDENSGLFGTSMSTEKKDYWKDFDIIAVAHVNNWDPQGNETSWARILGVEIEDITIEYQTESGRDATRVQTGFFQSQMLSMYRTYEAAVGQSLAKDGEQATATYINKIKNTDPSNGDLLDTVYIRIPFSAFGVDAGAFSSWTVPQLIVTFRTHILKVDKWIAVQQVAAEFKPSIEQKPAGDNPLGALDKLLQDAQKWVSNPFNQLGLAFFGVIALAVIVLVATPIGALLIPLLIRRKTGK